MSGHRRWVTSGELPVDEHQVQYVQGYILALDDLLEELERIDYASPDEADLMYEIRAIVNGIMGEARKTHKMLLEKVDHGTG